MSNDQLPLNKWTSLLEPNPQELLLKKSLSVSPPQAPPEVVLTSPAAMEETPAIFSVSDLNQLIKGQIENEFKSLWLQGEISNFKAHTSGHFYFSLKDDKSQISAVMFKGFNSRLKFRPESGMEVLVRGRVTVYEPRGSYQIFCETMEPVGAGALQKAFEQLKSKLQNEGLFEASRKKKLPRLPQHIGVVTSPTGAAIQDILNVLGRRYRGGQITVIPARVQGEGAADEVVRGIQWANQLGGFDVLIVGRGGGSIEDMWCFNEEKVARAIFASQIPIISAVGHEVDFTIADFVADVRAPTPSAAAEMVAQSAQELLEKIKFFKKRLFQRWQYGLSLWNGRLQKTQSRLVDPKRRLQDLSLRCDELQQRLTLSWQRQLRDLKMQVRLAKEQIKTPQALIETRRQHLFNLVRILSKEVKTAVHRRGQALQAQMSMLDSVSPLRVVNRGYALVFQGEKIVKETKKIQKNEELVVQLSQGALRVKVMGEEPSRLNQQEEGLWTSKKN